MKTIGIITPFHDNFGGGEVFINNISQYCNSFDQDYHIVVFTSDDTIYPIDHILIPKINKYSLLIKNFIKVCKIIEKAQVDYLILNDFYISQFAFLFRTKFKNVYSLLHGEVTYINLRRSFGKHLILLARCFLINVGSKKVLSVNKTNCKYFEKKKFNYIGNFVLPQNGINFPEKKETDFIFVGRLSPVKNLYKMIETFRMYCKKYDSSARLNLIGKGELYEEIREYVESLDVSNNIQLIGFVGHDDVLKLYTSSKCLLLFSVSEGFPTVVLESLMCGVPCVVSKVGSNEDVIIDGVNGFCFDIDEDLEKITEKLHRCLTEITSQDCIDSVNRFFIEKFWARFKSLL